MAAGDIDSCNANYVIGRGCYRYGTRAIPSPTGLEMGGINFAEDFSPGEMAALSSIAGQMGVGKVMAVQKMAGQMAAMETAGFDTKGMMGALDTKGMGIGSAIQGFSKCRYG